jgi:uncharacterized protein
MSLAARSGEWRMRICIRHVALATAAMMVMLAPAAAADDDEKGPLSEFYSYLPAAPDIHLPEFSIPFWTDDLKKAKRAYKAGDYERALKLFRRSSDDGNIVADWYLGHMYSQGVGVPRDDAMAYSYYTRVADHYDPEETDPNRLKITVDAMVRLADYQRTGAVNAGVQPDPRAAAQNYLKIATAYGHPAAQYALGVMSIRGEGVKKNPQQGLKWLMAAARKRYAPAEAYLGDLYWSGQIVNGDRTRAVMWYILARESARPDENPEIYSRAKQIEASVGEDERIEAEARARVWEEQYPAEKVRAAGD